MYYLRDVVVSTFSFFLLQFDRDTSNRTTLNSLHQMGHKAKNNKSWKHNDISLLVVPVTQNLLKANRHKAGIYYAIIKYCILLKPSDSVYIGKKLKYSAVSDLLKRSGITKYNIREKEQMFRWFALKFLKFQQQHHLLWYFCFERSQTLQHLFYIIHFRNLNNSLTNLRSINL